MLLNSPIGRACGAFFCLLFSATGGAKSFSLRDQNPFVLIHGLPFPASAHLPQRGELDWSAGVNITNTVNNETALNEVLLLDYESYELVLSSSYGLNEHWALRLDVPLIYYGGGQLDGVIDRWHDIFGLPQANRPFVEDNQYQLHYARGATLITDLQQADNGLGDIQLGLGHQLLDGAVHAASVWLTLDLPSGEADALRGNGASDVSVQLATAHRLDDSWQLDTSLALLFAGDSALNTVTIADKVWYAHSALSWLVHPIIDVRVQLQGHSDIYANSNLKLLGSSYQLVFGGSVHLDSCARVDIAVSEDLKAGASPDVSFSINYRRQTRCDH